MLISTNAVLKLNAGISRHLTTIRLRYYSRNFHRKSIVSTPQIRQLWLHSKHTSQLFRGRHLRNFRLLNRNNFHPHTHAHIIHLHFPPLTYWVDFLLLLLLFRSFYCPANVMRWKFLFISLSHPGIFFPLWNDGGQ